LALNVNFLAENAAPTIAKPGNFVGINNQQMKNFETSILIDAKPSLVWEVLMNHVDYPKWNPFIKSIKGNCKPGNKLEVRIEPPGKRPMTMQPQVLVCQQEQEFRWRGHLLVKGIFDGEHYFCLVPTGNNQTNFIHGENFSGFLQRPILRMVAESTLAGFEAMNKALKHRVEQHTTY
jgi:hypothetical protein